MQLTEKQVERYTHHIVLKEIGGEGQKRLLKAKVLVVGAGGLGSPAALYLAAAGVGNIGIIDDDVVEQSNLQRQILHSTGDLNRRKVESAKEKIEALNPDVKVTIYDERLTAENAKSIFRGYGFILDGSDNFSTKFLINDTCVSIGRPYSHAGIAGLNGQTFTYIPGSACLRCIQSAPPDECAVTDCRTSGILGSVAGIVGSIQATEAIKLIVGKGELLNDRLLLIDALGMEFTSVNIARDKKCPSCGK